MLVQIVVRCLLVHEILDFTLEVRVLDLVGLLLGDNVVSPTEVNWLGGLPLGQDVGDRLLDRFLIERFLESPSVSRLRQVLFPLSLEPSGQADGNLFLFFYFLG